MRTQAFEFLTLDYKDIDKEYQDYFYKYERYNNLFSMVLLYSHTPIEQDFLQKYLRQTDKLIQVQNNFYLIIFDRTSHDNGLKAVENLLYAYENKHFSQDLYISFVNTEGYTDAQTMKVHLLSFLNYAIKENKVNQITDGFYELESI